MATRKRSNDQVFRMYSKWIQGSSLRQIGQEFGGISGSRVGQLIGRMHWELGNYVSSIQPDGPFCNIRNKWLWDNKRRIRIVSPELSDELARRNEELSVKVKALRKRKVRTPEQQESVKRELARLVIENNQFMQDIHKCSLSPQS